MFATKFELKRTTIETLKYFESWLIVNSFEKTPHPQKSLNLSK